ncbi:DUF4365 domain-containing protein [Streptomyces sp. NPDC013130]|uniref:DUF4365 domain-containing protein n=1 Tax=Streptomyces sp. NPDC013130 TaxID=3156695 RepID=UPI0033F7A8AD
MPPRKRIRGTKATERAGVNALREYLESRDCVVQEVDTANDFGKDLLVDLTEDREITGQTIAVQVKSGESFSRKGTWGIPARSVDLNTWLESSIPVFGVVYDPGSDALHWMNLSAYVHEEMDARHEHKNIGKGEIAEHDRFKGHFVAFPEGQELTGETWGQFTEAVNAYGRRFGGRSLLDLMAQDPEAQLSAVHDCFALGRGDARALLLLRHTITELSSWAQMTAITALSHCVPHPDVFWSERNWIPRSVRDRVAQSFDWAPWELLHMVRSLEEVGNEGFPVWERGGYGADFVILLWNTPDVCYTLSLALTAACQGYDSEVAFRMLILYQYFLGIRHDQSGVANTVKELISRWPKLARHSSAGELVSLLEEHGWVDIF